jgi:hypothetical protein
MQNNDLKYCTNTFRGALLSVSKTTLTDSNNKYRESSSIYGGAIYVDYSTISFT